MNLDADNTGHLSGGGSPAADEGEDPSSDEAREVEPPTQSELQPEPEGFLRPETVRSPNVVAPTDVDANNVCVEQPQAKGRKRAREIESEPRPDNHQPQTDAEHAAKSHFAADKMLAAPMSVQGDSVGENPNHQPSRQHDNGALQGPVSTPMDVDQTEANAPSQSQPQNERRPRSHYRARARLMEFMSDRIPNPQSTVTMGSLASLASEGRDPNIQAPLVTREASTTYASGQILTNRRP